MEKYSFPRMLLCGLVAAVLALAVYAPLPATAEDIARPSNAGDAGSAATLKGDAQTGATLFATNCLPCHGAEGKGGVPNPGSTDGTVPPLNPLDSTLISKDAKVFAYNLDLFLQNGSTPEGTHPAIAMPAWGKDKLLSQQQIADLIAYIMSLNPAH